MLGTDPKVARDRQQLTDLERVLRPIPTTKLPSQCSVHIQVAVPLERPRRVPNLSLIRLTHLSPSTSHLMHCRCFRNAS
jgi:hypothetical protein